MKVKYLLEKINGYLYIKIEGYFTERLINKSRDQNILFWDTKRDKSTIVYAKIKLKDYRKLLKLAKMEKCRIKIIKKRGLPFILKKYRKRKILVGIVIISIISFIILSQFIWNIEIYGTESIDKEELMQDINNLGLKIGTLKRNINEEEIINKIRMERNDISWIGISMQGTNVKIQIVEADSKVNVIDDNEYCNIIANSDGQIVKVSAQNGIPVVKEGDIVTKGQILIEGWMDGKYTGTTYVHAEGEIKAKTWYTKKEQVRYKQVVSTYTEKNENKYSIKINKIYINLYKTLSKFEKYDTIETTKKAKIFSNLYLPFEVIKKTNLEKVESEITYSEEETKEQGIKKISEELDNETKGKEVLQKYINAYANTEYMDIEVIYEVLEDIGTKEKIVF